MITILSFITADLTQKSRAGLAADVKANLSKVVTHFGVYFEYLYPEDVSDRAQNQAHFTVFAHEGLENNVKEQITELLHGAVKRSLGLSTDWRSTVTFKYHGPEAYAENGVLELDTLNAK